MRAIEAGASSLGAPSDRPYGERSGFVQDLTGNHWYIATRFSTQVQTEDFGTVLPFLFPVKALAFIEFVEQAFEAHRMGVFEDGGRVVHAAVRMGDAVLEMGEPDGPVPDLPGRFLLHAEDCDAALKRAVAAGATPIKEAADQPDGQRTALIEDPFGYQWILSSLLPSR
jgi:uncharacterized glyoxalase superfamily protein PhnB